MYFTKYSILLGEETSRNHQAYREGHLDIRIWQEIRAVKVCVINTNNEGRSGRENSEKAVGPRDSSGLSIKWYY